MGDGQILRIWPYFYHFSDSPDLYVQSHKTISEIGRSNDNALCIMHGFTVMWVFQIWIPKFQRKTRGELPFMTANWLNNVMYAFQFVLIINIFMNKIKIENER